MVLDISDIDWLELVVFPSVTTRVVDISVIDCAVPEELVLFPVTVEVAKLCIVVEDWLLVLPVIIGVAVLTAPVVN